MESPKSAKENSIQFSHNKEDAPKRSETQMRSHQIHQFFAHVCDGTPKCPPTSHLTPSANHGRSCFPPPHLFSRRGCSPPLLLCFHGKASERCPLSPYQTPKTTHLLPHKSRPINLFSNWAAQRWRRPHIFLSSTRYVPWRSIKVELCPRTLLTFQAAKFCRTSKKKPSFLGDKRNPPTSTKARSFHFSPREVKKALFNLLIPRPCRDMCLPRENL